MEPGKENRFSFPLYVVMDLQPGGLLLTFGYGNYFPLPFLYRGTFTTMPEPESQRIRASSAGVISFLTRDPGGIFFSCSACTFLILLRRLETAC